MDGASRPGRLPHDGQDAEGRLQAGQTPRLRHGLHGSPLGGQARQHGPGQASRRQLRGAGQRQVTRRLYPTSHGLSTRTPRCIRVSYFFVVVTFCMM